MWPSNTGDNELSGTFLSPQLDVSKPIVMWFTKREPPFGPEIRLRPAVITFRRFDQSGHVSPDTTFS